jgi:predicted permease
VGVLLGRAITPQDDVPGAPPVLAIGYNVWQTTFGGDSSVLNQSLKIGNIAAPIVGVLPPDFFGLDPAFRYSVVMAMQPALARAVPAVLSDPHNWNGCQAVLGILRPGTPEERARAESEALVRQTIQADPPREPWEAPHMRLTSLDRGFDTLRKAAVQPFRILAAVASLILLITCSNIAGMLLAHGSARQKEIATRLAMGATHGRVIQQLLTESMLLSGMGGLAGILVAYAGTPLLPKLFQQFNYYQFNNLGVRFAPDARVLAFSVTVAALTGVLFGLGPALRTTRAALIAMIRMSTAVPGRFRFASGKTMLAAQVALAMVLLTGAGLLVRTLWNLRSVPMGYDPSGILYFTAETTSNRREFVSKVMSSLEALPGVSSSTASIWPLFTSAPDTYVQVCVSGDQSKNFDDRFADSDLIQPRFFETWRVPILRGRDFRPAESSDSVILNEAFVKRYLGGGDPLGAALRLGVNCSPATVVGVVSNSTDRPRIAPRPFVYKPYAYQPTQLTFTVRTLGDPSALIPSLRRIVADLGTRVFDPVTTGVEYRDRTMIQERLFTNLLSGFGALALLIASVGIYGVTI